MTEFFRRKPRILLIDEDELFCQLTALLLEDVVEFHYCRETFEGLKKAMEERWSVVLIEHDMPGLCSVEWIKRLHQVKEGLPVMIITSSQGTQDVVGVKKKPVDCKELLSMLEPYLPNKTYVTRKLERIAGISLGRLEDVARTTAGA
jgi:DNA-binding NtrC family response regulator